MNQLDGRHSVLHRKERGCLRSREYNFLAISSVKELKTSINHMNPQLQKLVQPSSLLTWTVEHLFRKNMPATNRTPTLLKFEYLFGPTIKELLKGLTNCGYHYFTGSGSHYERPDQLPLQFAELPSISKTSVVKMTKTDQETLCNIGQMHLARLSDSYM